MPNLGLATNRAKADLRKVSFWLENMSIYKLKWMVSVVVCKSWIKAVSKSAHRVAALFVVRPLTSSAHRPWSIQSDVLWKYGCTVYCVYSSASVSNPVLVLFFTEQQE